MIQNTIDCVLEKSKSVAFTGHRVLNKDFSKGRLEEVFKPHQSKPVIFPVSSITAPRARIASR